MCEKIGFDLPNCIHEYNTKPKTTLAPHNLDRFRRGGIHEYSDTFT